tara:strand:+ start:38 stop:475 length:438 start_codon:yes stop_codon:yes gene_type:complete
MKILNSLHKLLGNLRNLDFIGFTAIRMYLFFVFWSAGTDRLNTFDEFSKWLGSLGMVFPEILSWLVIATEAGGAFLLLVGLFVRWITIPLLIVMANAILLVHWDNGWAQESNGIEMAVTYSVMLLILLFSGGGKYFSLDYWINRN